MKYYYIAVEVVLSSLLQTSSCKTQVVLSLGIGALGCLLSATAYAELSSRVVAAGSVYAYAQVVSRQ